MKNLSNANQKNQKIYLTPEQKEVIKTLFHSDPDKIDFIIPSTFVSCFFCYIELFLLYLNLQLLTFKLLLFDKLQKLSFSVILFTSFIHRHSSSDSIRSNTILLR